jgi:hypothetical protein
LVLIALAGVFAALGAELVIIGAQQLGVGQDFAAYMERTAAFAAGRGFYLPEQLAGPYLISMSPPDMLYPPPTLLLFVPFLYLPAFLWWAIPLSITAVIIVHHRPAVWTWPFMAFCTIWGIGFANEIIKGNVAIWSMAATALGTVWPQASPFVLIKWTMAPFALVGIRKRGWWIGAGVAALACLAFVAMWPDYIVAIANARGRTLGYALSEYEMMLIPLLAWLGRTRVRTSDQLPNNEAELHAAASPHESRRLDR